jgi:hypothetical protein
MPRPGIRPRSLPRNGFPGPFSSLAKRYWGIAEQAGIDTAHSHLISSIYPLRGATSLHNVVMFMNGESEQVDHNCQGVKGPQERAFGSSTLVHSSIFGGSVLVNTRAVKKLPRRPTVWRN